MTYDPKYYQVTEYHGQKANARRQSAKQKWLNERKNHPCADCGEKFPPECMDFDHVRGEKLFNVGQGAGRLWSDILDEIAKCELVCANCHRVRTRQRGRKHAPTQRYSTKRAHAATQ